MERELSMENSVKDLHKEMTDTRTIDRSSIEQLSQKIKPQDCIGFESLNVHTKAQLRALSKPRRKRN